MNVEESFGVGRGPGRGRDTDVGALGNTTSYSYDAAGWLVETTSGAGVTETFGYDDRGLQSSRSNEFGHTWSTTYDGAGRPLVETNPRGLHIGWIFEKTDHKRAFDLAIRDDVAARSVIFTRHVP